MYWKIGERIVVEEQQRKERADYGIYLLHTLAIQIESEFGSAFSYRQLAFCRQFYRTYPILSAKAYNTKLKCTIHSSGKLGFTEETAKQLKFNESSSVMFATDNEDETVLYLFNVKGTNEDAFKIYKAGAYFYVNTKILFDSLKYDYTNNTIIFDMMEIKDDKNEIYKLNKREKLRKDKDSYIQNNNQG